MRDHDGVRIDHGPALIATSGFTFVTNGLRSEVDGKGRARLLDPLGTVVNFEHMAPANPTGDQLDQLTGIYASDEAETAFVVARNGSTLVLKRRPNTTLILTPSRE